MAVHHSVRQQQKVPQVYDWRTTDEEEVQRRRLRAQAERFRITNADARYPIFSNFRVQSPSGLIYSVEIRDVSARLFSCDCTDFRKNGLGTCKHVEAVLLYLQSRHRRAFAQAAMGRVSFPRIDVIPDRAADNLKVERGRDALPPAILKLFDRKGMLCGETIDAALGILQKAEAAGTVPGLRLSQDLQPWLQAREQSEERVTLRREYEQKVQAGQWPTQETLSALYPYQREGMLHLAFTERALLADEMGLGKTIQAIAACALLQRLGKASHVLIVTPASLKTEWEDQIQQFTSLPYQVIYGLRPLRLKAYVSAPFFTIVNYEQMIRDCMEVNRLLKPDVVILDEAQRIKNWETKTAQAVKRLQSRYAFVLTGTPIENRIDELYSIMDFLQPTVLGPLFRFNREFYQLDDRGRPSGYKNLDRLHARIQPYLLRRRKADVESELPDRTDRTFFVPLSIEQANTYADHENQIARLVSIAKRRPLTEAEQLKLMRELAMARMVCDTNYILDPEDRVCPKLSELQKILEEVRENPEVKVIIFSEWERMLQLVMELCRKLKLGYACHTGSVPQRRRRAEILRFKSDPECRIFLSTDSGSTGLNLQVASLVINCDLPWNPAKLEQRIARCWRKHQMRPVTVIHLVSENTIEHRMLATLSMKQALADGVLDLRGNLNEIQLASGRQVFLARLQQMLSSGVPGRQSVAEQKSLPVDRSLAFSLQARERLGDRLLLCEERYPLEGSHSVLYLVVDRDAALYQERLKELHGKFFGDADPLAAVRLQVIDRATDAALKGLIDAGLIAGTTRAARPLYPPGSTPALTQAEREQVLNFRDSAARKLKMGRLLGDGEMPEEGREAILQSIHSLSQALAVKTRKPPIADLNQLAASHIAGDFGRALPALCDFIRDPAASWRSAADALQSLLTASEMWQ